MIHRGGALLLTLAACGSEAVVTTQEDPPLGQAGSATAPPAGSSGSGGKAGVSGTGGGAGLAGSPASGSSGAPIAGSAQAGAGTGPACPPESFAIVPGCGAPSSGPCGACVCAMSKPCETAWATCLADDGCGRALDCLLRGCSASSCAVVSGAGQSKLLELYACFVGPCATPCSGGTG